MPGHREHIRAAVIKRQAAKPLAFGGCGCPDIMVTALRVSPMMVLSGGGAMLTVEIPSFTRATVSKTFLIVFVPLCGLIWTLDSSNPESSNASESILNRIKVQAEKRIRLHF